MMKEIVIFPDAFICLNCGAVFVAVEDFIDHATITGHMPEILKPDPEPMK